MGGKQKCGKTENLMEPKAGPQGDHWKVQSPEIGPWRFLRLMTEFAECTPFIEMRNSPSPRPHSPRESQGFCVNSQKPLSLPSHPPPPQPPWRLRALSSAEREGPRWGRDLLGPSSGLCVSALLPPPQDPVAFVQALSATHPQPHLLCRVDDGHTAVAAPVRTSAPHGFGVMNHSPLLSLR